MHGNIWAHTFEPVHNRKQSCKFELQGQGFVVNHSLCHLLLFFPPLMHSWLCANHGRSNRRNANGGNKIGGNFAHPCPKLLCPAPRVPWPRPPAGKRGGGSRPGLGMRQNCRACTGKLLSRSCKIYKRSQDMQPENQNLALFPHNSNKACRCTSNIF